VVERGEGERRGGVGNILQAISLGYDVLEVLGDVRRPVTLLA
jgi:hypothetical protein